MENFVAIRNGILEHLAVGNLGPFDLGIYLFLHLRANWATGVYQGSALTIAFQFGDARIKEHVQKSLRRLRDRHYINYRNGDGKRGAYPILINKYEPTVGELFGTRLDAWKNGDLVRPEYDSKNSGGTVVAQSRNSGGTAVAPIQDLKTVQDIQDGKSSVPRGTHEPKRATRIPDNFAVIEEHRKFTLEEGLADPALHVDAFKDYWRAKAGKDGLKLDWDATFRNWLRRAAEMSRKGNGYGNGNRAERRQAANLNAREAARAAVMAD
jgi:hypothetical protein